MEMKEIREACPIIDGIMVIPPLGKAPYLVAGRCSNCGKAFFPQKKICPLCFDQGRIEEIALTGRGKLSTFTVVRRAVWHIQVPYAIGYINTPENIMIFTRLTDCALDHLTIGMEMEVVFEEAKGEKGQNFITYKFRPVE